MTAKAAYRETKRLKAHERNELILEAAKDILIHEGFARFSLRYVAERSDIRLATLQYYYSTKELLFRAVFEDALATEQIRLDRLVTRAGDSPESILRARIAGHFRISLNDDTAGFFYQLWARANLDEFVAELMDEFYEQTIQHMCGLIAACNPKLARRELRRRAVHVSSTLEGATVFASIAGRARRKFELTEKYVVDSLVQFATAPRNRP